MSRCVLVAEREGQPAGWSALGCWWAAQSSVRRKLSSRKLGVAEVGKSAVVVGACTVVSLCNQVLHRRCCGVSLPPAHNTLVSGPVLWKATRSHCCCRFCHIPLLTLAACCCPHLTDWAVVQRS